MKPHSNYYNRRLSGSYSRRVENKKRRLSERRKDLGRPIDETKSRKEFWAGYFSLIQKASEGLEAGYNTNGGFEDRLEAQQEHFQSLPFRFVIRYLSDNAFSYMKRLPLFNGAEIPTMQPKGYRYAGTIVAEEKENLLNELLPEEVEEIMMLETQKAIPSYPDRINIYVRKDIPELRETAREFIDVINKDYNLAGRKLDYFMPKIGEREKAILLKELQPILNAEQRKILHKATQPKIENIVY